jgi:hypothetical protein
MQRHEALDRARDAEVDESGVRGEGARDRPHAEELEPELGDHDGREDEAQDVAADVRGGVGDCVAEDHRVSDRVTVERSSPPRVAIDAAFDLRCRRRAAVRTAP